MYVYVGMYAHERSDVRCYDIIPNDTTTISYEPPHSSDKPLLVANHSHSNDQWWHWVLMMMMMMAMMIMVTVSWHFFVYG